MERESSRSQSFAIWVAGAALGAAAMYLADPDRGRRRRALATDKMRSMATRTADTIDVASRDMTNRMQGMRARATRLFSQRAESSDDETMVAHIRQEIGKISSHPRAIKVYVLNGRIHLHGPIFAHEKQQLLDRIRSMPGVTGVEDKLETHESAAGIPGLQGEGKLRRAGASFMQDSWPPALRAAATIGGGALGLFGLVRRNPVGIAAAAIGLGLVARSISNRSFTGVAGMQKRAIDLHKTIYIHAAPETVFDIWSRYENFPQFMSNVLSVSDLGNGRSHWVVSGPAGSRIEWRSIITEANRPERLAWRSEPDATVQHTGMVHFEPEGDGTRVSVHLSYNPPAGAFGHAVASLFNGNPKQQMDADLMRMKSFIESGIPPHDAAQPITTQSMHPTGATLH